FPCRVDGRDTHAVVTADGLDLSDGLVSWLDVDEVVEGDHRVRLERPDRPPIELSLMGAGFDRFMAALHAARGLARRAAMVQATGDPIDSYVARDRGGLVDVHLYATGVVLEPRIGPPTFMPLPLVRSLDRDGYEITWSLRGLSAVTLRGFGARTDELVLDTERARTELRVATSAAYVQLDPALAGLDAPDGWALDADGARDRWPSLRAMATAGRRSNEVQALMDLCGATLRVGVWTAGGGEAMPFVLAPVAGRVAVEATDADDRATFVFATDDVDWLNAALILTNFRREVLSFEPAELGRWAVAVRMLQTVRDLRAALVARVVHDATWSQRITSALTNGG
ncbi:MAG TPA: hypothetical protein VF855_13930, partial [Acidimicrobiales bacterium]